ncbi:MAG TPA: MoaD/ThiS family protein [Actinomycetota bacterium]|nr:MoaD/ThiS family protein [Actinomycetota bacterium]
MAVLRVAGPLRALAGGNSEHEVEAGTVLELLRLFEDIHPATSGWILDERGRIRQHINVFVNAELAVAATPLATGDQVDVLPAISGGSRHGRAGDRYQEGIVRPAGQPGDGL